jgi:hypothetical protein
MVSTLSKRLVLGLSMGVACLLTGQGICAHLDAALTKGQCPPPFKSIYFPSPTTSTAEMGFFSTGMVLADVNGDRLEDMVVSNGNDMSPQPLTIFYNKKGVFNNYPDWYSDDSGYRMGLAVGDIDGDGRNDVAVAVGMGLSREMGTGFVEVFFNRGGILERKASYRTAGGFMTLGCALGDVNGDGRLDLVVPVVSEMVGPFPPSSLPTPGRARIYLNRDGALDHTPDWITAEGNGATDAVVADINQDGWMDVAFSSHHTEVYYGHPPGGTDPVPLPKTPGWTGADLFQLSYSLDAGSPGILDGLQTSLVPGRKPLMLAVSSSCPLGSKQCESGFFLYRPDLGTAPVWRSEKADLASKVLLADLRNSGALDLLANQWGSGNPPTGTPLWFFQARPTGYYKPSPDFETKQARVGQGIAVADLMHRAVSEVRHVFKATETATVLTLPQRRIMGIQGVEREQGKLVGAEYSWAPGTNSVSLARPLQPGETVAVTYQASPVMDIAEAVWQPQFGSDLYYSLLNVPCSAGTSRGTAH